MDYCMRVYGAKNFANTYIYTESQFAKFNARQIFPLYVISMGINCSYRCLYAI